MNINLFIYIMTRALQDLAFSEYLFALYSSGIRPIYSLGLLRAPVINSETKLTNQTQTCMFNT